MFLQDTKDLHLPSRTDFPELFEEGNYYDVALFGPDDLWQTHAAIGLTGKLTRAIAALRRFQEPDARFYLAVCLWMAKEEREAEKLLAALIEGHPAPLSGLRLEHARNLLSLIRKPVIDVLSMSPHNYPFTFLHGIRHDRKFRVRNISYRSGDLPEYPGNSIHVHYDRSDPPDFFFVGKIESPALPLDMHELPCPTIGHIADQEIYTQSSVLWLDCFDHVIAGAGTEYDALRPLCDNRVTTFTKLTSLSENLPALPQSGHARDIGMIFTGAVLHPFYQDKSQLISAIFRDRPEGAYMINGYVPASFYWRFFKWAKMSFNQTRLPRGLQTRAVESLAMGCPSLVQHGSALSFFAETDGGMAHYYDYDLASIRSAIDDLLDDFERHETAAHQGAEVIRREFSEERVSSEYFRFNTYLAARPGWGNRNGPLLPTAQKRAVIMKGWMPGNWSVVGRQMFGHLRQWKADPNVASTATGFIDIARELVLLRCQQLRHAPLEPDSNGFADEKIEEALKYLEEGVARFPRSLALFFDYLRVSVHFGDCTQASAAVEALELALNEPETYWDVSPYEDVFPWDFANTHYNYRASNSAVLRAHADKDGPEGTRALSDLRDLIRASLYYYFGCHRGDVGALRRAVELDPDFTFYKLAWCDAVLELDNDPEVRAQALRSLADISAYALVAVPSIVLLSDHWEEASGLGIDVENLTGEVLRFAQQTIHLDETSADLGTAFQTAMSMPHAKLVNRPRTIDRRLDGKSHGPERNPTISIVAMHQLGVVPDRLVGSIAAQNAPKTSFELLWITPLRATNAAKHERIDLVVHSGKQSYAYHKGLGFNRAIESARAPWLLICDGVAELAPGTVSDLLSRLPGLDEEHDALLLFPTSSGADDSDGPTKANELRPVEDVRGCAPGALIVSRSAFDRVKGFSAPGVYGGEVTGLQELLVRLRHTGIRFLAPVPEPVPPLAITTSNPNGQNRLQGVIRDFWDETTAGRLQLPVRGWTRSEATKPLSGRLSSSNDVEIGHHVQAVLDGQEYRNLRTRNPWPPGHFYSPIPDLSLVNRLRDSIFRGQRNLPNVEINESSQLELLDVFRHIGADFALMLDARDEHFRYDPRNDFFLYGDAVILFCMLMHHRSAAVVEVGSGYSSALLLDVRDRRQPDLRLTFIEPNPGDRLYPLTSAHDREDVRIFPYEVQVVEKGLFAELNAGDLLFIDTGHVSKTGGELNYLLFEILPQLRPGVIIHFHDIFWPFEYPETLVLEKGYAWSEVYLLRAFLSSNKDYRVLFMNNFMGCNFSAEMAEAFPRISEIETGAESYCGQYGSGLWLEKTR